MNSAREKLIVALDVADGARALALVRELREHVTWFKIGLQLFIAEGPPIVERVRAEGAKVFLDLKLHDIPNTVASAVRSASKLGASMLTIHLSGGAEMVRAAVDAAPNDLLLLGVTVLTSSDDETLRSVGVAAATSEQVLRLARLGREAGLRGFVASAHELAALRAGHGAAAKFVVPGIRPSGSGVGDQKRTMTPGEAIGAGADYIVVGRPITATQNPLDAVAQIARELG